MLSSVSGEEAGLLLNIFLLLVISSFYIMGLMSGRKGNYFFLAGLALHMLSILQRGVVTGGLPLTERHDNVSFMGFAMAIIYGFIQRKKPDAGLGVAALPLISVTVLIPLLYQPADTLSPFMRSPWFYLHIFFYCISYGFFGISSCIGLLYVLGRRAENEAGQYRTAIAGWVMFSLSLVMGSIWFFIAYGTYWLWTSRELWVMLTWFYYGLYLHARLMKGFRGWPASAAGLAGFGVALFTYFGVGTIIPSPPTQF